MKTNSGGRVSSGRENAKAFIKAVIAPPLALSRLFWEALAEIDGPPSDAEFIDLIEPSLRKIYFPLDPP